MKQYAYIRVSSKEQKIDRQLNSLEPYDLPEENIFIDFQSGKNFDRPAYKRLMKKLKPGDLLIVKSIDRLGKNYDEILVQWQFITKEIKADILVLDMALLDTRVKSGNLTGTLIADLVLQILAYVAQTEREFIRQRQAEGIAAAKQRGVCFGAPPKSRPAELKECVSLWRQGRISAREGGRRLGVTHSTFLCWAQECGEEDGAERMTGTGAASPVGSGACALAEKAGE